eukprot:TRINITY_DN2357_c0_g2_i12.p1 TRINITY_DN2357_c0_g2~~TRINITY_DN2357_c0_g2_i12.p1  ORF type:complete len:112 (+),score=5.75 TRINITY_DN2357_c0_g2_i12:227-562(+)
MNCTGKCNGIEQVAYVDLWGILRSKMVPLSNINAIAKHGAGFAGKFVFCFESSVIRKASHLGWILLQPIRIWFVYLIQLHWYNFHGTWKLVGWLVIYMLGEKYSNMHRGEF